MILDQSPTIGVSVDMDLPTVFTFDVLPPSVLATPGQGQGGPVKEVENLRGTAGGVVVVLQGGVSAP
jgi:hypothetical protein